MIKQIEKNKYRFIVSVGSGSTRKRFTKTVSCKGKKELKRQYDEFEAKCRNMPLSDITVRQMVEAYIVHMKVLGRKATTIRGYKTTAERIYSSVGESLARNLTTAQLEEKIALMSDNGLSAKTIKNTVGLLSAAYEHAIFIEQLEKNPCKHIVLPKGQPRETRILYRDEIQPFLNAIADEDINDKVAYELALFLGLRRSEILGLKEEDVDIVSGMIYVHNTRHRVDKEDLDQDTKTKRSTRVLALPDILIMDIARLLETHRRFKYEKVDYLIQDGYGNIVNPSSLASRLDRLEKEKGLPHVTLHGLRHTYASLLHSEGVDMAMISRELGHSNLATTMNIYTHIFQSVPESSKGIASAINNFMTPQNTTATNLPQIENKNPSE